jgi:SAM-dependent methyltransferase
MLHLGDESFAPFDPASAQYDARLAFDAARINDIVSIIERHVAVRGNVLDLGAAPYITTSTLVAHGYAVVANGIPIPGLAKHGELHLGINGATHRVSIELFDAEGAYSLDDEAFDCVVAGEIFEHLNRQPWKLLSESWRVLRPGGLLLITTPNGQSLERLYGWLKRGPTGHGFNPASPTGRHAREYSVSELDAVVTSQGFDVKDIFTRNYAYVDRDGFRGRLGPIKRIVYTKLLRMAEERTGLLSNRAQTIFVVARRSSHPPGPPPGFMRYGGTDVRTGYNFDTTGT